MKPKTVVKVVMAALLTGAIGAMLYYYVYIHLPMMANGGHVML